MASKKQVTPEEFAAIAGDVSLEDAERYLKMGKNNLELALNYFFNKKDKTTKPPPEESPKPMTLMQKLQEGGKKQAHVEKLVKELTNDVPRSTQNDSKKKSTVTKYTSPSPSTHGGNSQKSSSAKQGTSTVSKNGGSVTKTVSKRGSETKTPDNKERLENFFRFGSMNSQPETQKKIATPSTAISKGVIEEDRIEDISIDNMVIEDPKINNDLIASLHAEPTKNAFEEVKRLEEKAISEFKRHCSMTAELNADSIEIETSGGDVIQPPQIINTTKNFKRTFTQFSSIHEEDYDFGQSLSNQNAIEMTIEDPAREGEWPKVLGNLIVKGHIVCSLKTEVKVGDNLELKLEKPHVVEKKKGGGGARSKANNNSASPAPIMRVLYNDQELGKLDTAFSGPLGQLLDKNYIKLEVTLDEPPLSWSTFAQFYVDLKVLLLPSAISKPLTKVRSSHEDLSIEDEAILNDLQQTKEAFMWLFESLGLQMKTPTLVKRTVMPIVGNQKSLKKKNSLAKEEENEEESKNQQQQHQPQNVENELFKYLHSSEDYFSCEELEPSQVISLLSLPVDQEEAKVLTWMLLREGSNENQREVLYRKARILHPLWEEYILQEGSLLYFNPFTGQLSVETPKNTFDCSGGIIGNMERGLKVQMVAGLVNANRFDRETTGGYDPMLVRKKNLIMIHGRSTVSNIMKGPLLPAGTLLIVPVNSLYFWESALSRLRNQDKAMKVLVYYGQKRAQEGKDLGVGAYDVVLTTYGIISGEFSGEGKKDLYNYEWFRVILDEAHYIKGKRIQTVKAIEDLNMLNRWCLSGINEKSKLEDLYNMVNFLKIEPWNCLTWWNAHIGKPILEKGEAESFEIVKTILSPLALILNNGGGEFGQRMARLSQIMEAEKSYKVEMVELAKEERDYYGCLYKKSKTEFDKLLGLDALAENYTQAYALAMRIRYACDHLFLIYSKFEIRDSDCLAGEIVDFLGAHYEDNDENASKRESIGDELSIKDPSSLRDKFHDHFEIVMDENTRVEHVLAIQKPHAIVNREMVQETVERLNQGDVVHCPICLNDLENAVVTICGHILCNVCEKKSIEDRSMCPVCSTILTRKDCLNITREIGFVFDISEKYRRSSKLEILMTYLSEAVNAAKKCIVLSHFHPMLLLLEYDLAVNEVDYLKIHAAMDEEERIQIIQQFNSCGETSVLLSTMVLGDIGTEKLMGDVVFIVEPSNDEKLEIEALKNILAGGVENKLDIMKFVCRDTIEEHILKLNEIKRDDLERKPLKNVEEKINDCIQDLCYLMKQGGAL